MSACRLALLISLVLVLALAASDSGGSVMRFQPVADFSTDSRVQLIDQFVRGQHPTELASAVLTGADLDSGNLNYRLLYSANGDNFLAITKQTSASSTITEVHWGKVRKAREGATSAMPPANEPIVGAYGQASVPQNDPEFDFVDKFVRDIKKEELKDAKVVSVRTQVVAGRNYKILYQGQDGKRYEAVVFRQVWTNTTQLSSFEELQPTVPRVGAAAPDSTSSANTMATPLIVAAYQPVTDRTNSLFLLADKFARSAYPIQLNGAVVTDVAQQIVSGTNYKINYDSPSGKYQVIVYQQPWTNTIQVSRFEVLERKGLPPVAKIADSLYQPLRDYQNDPNFQSIDSFVRNRYAAMLNGAVLYSVQKTVDSNAYKISYQVGNKLVSVEAAINTPQQPASRRRLLQAVGSFVDLPNYISDSSFMTADRMVRSSYPQQLANSQIVRAERQNNGDSVNYRITYQTATGSYEAIVYQQLSSGSMSLTSWKSSTTPQAVSSSGVFNPNAAFTSSSGTWQLASTSDPVVQRVDQLVRQQNPQIGNGPLLKVESQNGNSYRLQYGIADNTAFQIVVTYNQAADSIFTVSSKTDSSSSYMVRGATAANAANIANVVSGGAVASADGFVPLLNFQSDPDFLRIDQYARSKVPQLQGATVNSVRVQNNGGTSYKIQYLTTAGSVMELTISAQSLAADQSVQPTPASTTTTTTTTTTTSSGSSGSAFTTLAGFSSNPSFLQVDQYLRSNIPQLAGSVVQTVETQSNGQITNYRINYRLTDGSIVNASAILNNGNVQITQVSSNGVATTPSTPVSSTTTSSSTTSSVIPTTSSTTTTSSSTTSGTTSTTLGTTSATTSDGYVTLPNYSSDSNVARSDQQIQSQIPQLSGATIVGVWSKQLPNGGTSYKLRYRTNSGAFTEVAVDQAPNTFTQAPSSAPLTTAATTTVATQETALVNFQSNEGVQKVKEYVQQNVPTLRDASIVGVWTSYTPEGLTNYRTRFLTPDGQFIEVNLAYQQQKGIVQPTAPTTQTTTNTTTILATTPDGYQLLRNFGIDPTFLKIDQYARVQKPELAGARVNAVWTRQIDVGTSYRIRYTTNTGNVVEVTLVYRPDTDTFEINPAVPTAPPTTTTTTTTSTVGYQILQNYVTDPDFQLADAYIRSQLTTLVNSQIIAVWIDAIPGTNRYRVQYLLPDGSIQEVYVSYLTSTRTTQITSKQEIAPPVVKKTTQVNVTQTTITPVAPNTTTTTSQQTNNATVINTASTIFNPNWTPKNYSAPTNTTTQNTTTVTTQYFPGITLTPNFTNPVVAPTVDNTTTNFTQNITTTNTTFNPNWQPPVVVPGLNLTTTNTTTVNTTFIPSRPTPLPTIDTTNTTYTSTNVTYNPNWTPTTPLPNFNLTTTNTSTVNTTFIPTRPTSPPSVFTNTTIDWTTKYPQVPINNTAIVVDTTTSYQSMDYNTTEINAIDVWCRQQLPKLVDARIINVWRLIGTYTYKIEYITLDGVSVVCIINRVNNDQLVLASVTSNTNIVNTTTINNYQTLNNYSSDADFNRVDQYIRSVLQQLVGAKIIQVWIQFLDSGVVNYRIQYMTAGGIIIEVTGRRTSATGTIEIVSNKIISNTTTTNTTTSTTNNTTVVVVNNEYTVFSGWATNTEFLQVDRYVRSQFPQLRNGQIVAVWMMVQLNVGVYYRIQYLLNGRTVQITVNKIKDSDRMSIVSSSLTDGFQPLSGYRTDTGFLSADQFARTQLPQLVGAQVVAVWIQISVGTSYRIQYNTTTNVLVEVVVSYDAISDSYTFDLISPLSLLSSIVRPDPLCRTFRRNICIECSFRSVFDANRRCKEVSTLCNTYDLTTGKCMSCYDGYTLNNGACVSTASLLPPNCVDIQNGVCIECSLGFILMGDNTCQPRMPGCLTMLSDGRCVSCSVGYLLQGSVCKRNY